MHQMAHGAVLMMTMLLMVFAGGILAQQIQPLPLPGQTVNQIQPGLVARHTAQSGKMCVNLNIYIYIFNLFHNDTTM